MRLLERLKTFTRSLEDVSLSEPKDYGIDKKTLVSKIVIYRLPPRHDRKALNTSVLRRSPVWLTTSFPDSDTHYIIDETGNQSDVYINLKDPDRHYEAVNVQGLESLTAFQIEDQKVQYLLLKLTGNDWTDDIAPVVSGWSIVSGNNVRSGIFRDIFTRVKHKVPFRT